jgi:hypothetical protein
MKCKIPFGVLIIPVFCTAVIPAFIALKNMSTVIAWFLSHGATDMSAALTEFVIFVLLGTALLLFFGIALFNLLEQWYLKKKKPPLSSKDAAGSGENLNGFDNIVDSMNASLKRLRELSKIINEQSRAISRIRRGLSPAGIAGAHEPATAALIDDSNFDDSNSSGQKTRAVLAGRGSYTFTEQKVCDNSAIDIPPGSGPSSGPTRETRSCLSLSEAEAMFIYLNQLRLDAEFGPCRESWKKRG